MEKINLRDCDLMTIKEWNEAVKCGMITSDDGIGYYATSEEFSKQWNCWGFKPGWATHVVWFNK